MLYRVHLVWMEFKLTTLVVIDTDCIDSYTYDHDHDGPLNKGGIFFLLSY